MPFARKTLTGFAAILAAVSMTACSGSSAGKTGGPKTVACDSLVGKPGAAWAPVVNGPGCTEGDTLLMSASYDCKDGSKLIWFGQSPTWYYGKSTEPLHSSPTNPSLGNNWPFTQYPDCS